MRTPAIAIALSIAFGAYLALHFIEPAFSITWSYAHLGRSTALPVAAALLVVVLPAVAVALARLPASSARLRPWSWPAVAAAIVATSVVAIAIGAAFPSPHFSIDVLYFVESVRDGRDENARWYLLLWLMTTLVRWLQGWLAADTVIRTANGVFAAIAVVALVAAARRLAQTRGEAAALTLLAAGAFGVAQLLMGYLDIYPLPLAITAVYVWTAFAAIDGVLHPAVPLVIAAIGPLWYIGLAQLIPSALVVVAVELRRGGGVTRVAVAAIASVVLAGLATIPGFGRPFAWGALFGRIRATSKFELGLDPMSSLLPLDYMLSGAHLREVLHTLLLVDGVGWILVLICGTALLMGRRFDAKAALLASLALTWLAYLVTFDPLFGAYADWDLYSYGTVASSLLGGWALIVWGHDHPRAAAALVGLALAATSVHLLARLNALDFDLERHLAESPYHISTE